MTNIQSDLQGFTWLENPHSEPIGGPLAAYTNNYNGGQWFHVRRMYCDRAGTWRPGKQGISCPVEGRSDLLVALLTYVSNDTEAVRRFMKQRADAQRRADAPSWATAMMPR